MNEVAEKQKWDWQVPLYQRADGEPVVPSFRNCDSRCGACSCMLLCNDGFLKWSRYGHCLNPECAQYRVKVEME